MNSTVAQRLRLASAPNALEDALHASGSTTASTWQDDTEANTLVSSKMQHLYQGSLLNPNPYFHPLKHVPLMASNSLLNMIVEIPTGTNWKIETNDDTGAMGVEYKNGQPRFINYLGYLGNYGFVPQTLTNKAQGWDGDPVDIISLSPAKQTGHVVAVKVLGALDLLDNGERDLKVIAVDSDSPMADVNSLDELNERFPAVLEMLRLWFSHYKTEQPLGTLQVTGYLSREATMPHIYEAHAYWKAHSQKHATESKVSARL